MTASTVASSGRPAAAAAKRAKSSAAHHASTVDTSIGPAGPRPVTSRKLSSDDPVVFTMKSSSSAGNRVRTHSTHSRSCSFSMMVIAVIPAVVKLRNTVPISGSPATSTRGFGTR